MEPLKEAFNPAFFQNLVKLISAEYPAFAGEAFYQTAIATLDDLELKARMRRTASLCHQFLPTDYARSLEILYPVAPQIENGLVGMFLPEYVGMYGLDNFELSLSALKYFTTFSTAEFAIREFLRRDLERTLVVLQTWSQDENFHVRRLSSEGSRPRLPWSFKLTPIIENPALVQPILENLKADPELYVRKSVANHLNDISKDHPAWMLKWVSSWDQSDPHTAWIIKRGARSLIKAGHPGAFALFGFTVEPKVDLMDFCLSASNINLGETLTFSFALKSETDTPQKLVVDYLIHYVKKSGKTQPKVFKLKEIELAPNEQISISKSQTLKDFSTRTHYPGQHHLEIMVNGQILGRQSFDLFKD